MKMKRARVGANATCIECKEQFKVDDSTMMEEPGTEAAADAASPIPTAMPGAAASPDKGVPTAGPRVSINPDAEETGVDEAEETGILAEEASDTGIAAAALDSAAADEAQRTAEVVAEIEAEFSSGVSGTSVGSRRRRRRRRRTGAQLTVPAVLVALVLGGLLWWMVWGGDPEPDGAGDGDRAVTPAPKTAKGSSGKNGGKTEPPDTPATPEIALQALPIMEPKWQQFVQPILAIRPAPDADVLLWSYRLKHDRNRGRAMIVGQYVSGTPRVYRSATLQVQLLNASGRAYAQLEQRLSVLCARQGLTVRVPVPEKLLGSFVGLVAQLIPHQPMDNAVALEPLESRTRLVPGTLSDPVVELALRNTLGHDAVEDPLVVIELLSEDGWPRGAWSGSLKGTIGPRQELVFRAHPPIDRGAGPGRLIVRAYATKTP